MVTSFVTKPHSLEDLTKYTHYVPVRDRDKNRYGESKVEQEGAWELERREGERGKANKWNICNQAESKVRDLDGGETFL